MPTIKDIIIKKPTPDELETCKTWPIWQSDIATFDWDYTQTETCLIIEGKVTITAPPPSQDSITFGPGDMVIFPEALICVWKVEQPVKKYYSFS